MIAVELLNPTLQIRMRFCVLRVSARRSSTNQARARCCRVFEVSTRFSNSMLERVLDFFEVRLVGTLPSGENTVGKHDP